MEELELDQAEIDYFQSRYFSQFNTDDWPKLIQYLRIVIKHYENGALQLADSDLDGEQLAYAEDEDDRKQQPEEGGIHIDDLAYPADDFQDGNGEEGELLDRGSDLNYNDNSTAEDEEEQEEGEQRSFSLPIRNLNLKGQVQARERPFSHADTCRLERDFRRDANPCAGARMALARELQVSEVRLGNWFAQRRRKLRTANEAPTRSRHTFSRGDLAQLNDAFALQPYPAGAEVMALAQLLDTSKSSVSHWFTNKRHLTKRLTNP